MVVAPVSQTPIGTIPSGIVVTRPRLEMPLFDTLQAVFMVFLEPEIVIDQSHDGVLAGPVAVFLAIFPALLVQL